jgi:hypothetical protein
MNSQSTFSRLQYWLQSAFSLDFVLLPFRCLFLQDCCGLCSGCVWRSLPPYSGKTMVCVLAVLAATHASSPSCAQASCGIRGGRTAPAYSSKWQVRTRKTMGSSLPHLSQDDKVHESSVLEPLPFRHQSDTLIHCDSRDERSVILSTRDNLYKLVWRYSLTTSPWWSLIPVWRSCLGHPSWRHRTFLIRGLSLRGWLISILCHEMEMSVIILVDER